MANAAEELAARIRGMATIPDPWPHATLDDFLPGDVFAELLAALPSEPGRRNLKKRDLPACVFDLLRSPIVLDAVRERFGFVSGSATIEASYTGRTGIPAHIDRPDKLWSGQVYLVGDEKGTELLDAAGNVARRIEWKANRLVCWTRPPNREKHAAPKSSGRWVLLYWIMGER